jgi:hypothetical protein
MRKRAIFVLLIDVAIISAIYLFYVTNTKMYYKSTYRECIFTAYDYDNLKNVRRQADLSDFKLYFDEQELLFSENIRRFYYSLVEGSPTSNNPSISLISNGNNLKMGICEDTITDDLIENNRLVKFIIYSDDVYQEYSLVCSILPFMNISCDDSIGNDAVNMSISLFDNEIGSTNRVINSNGTIKIRGASTRDYPKKAYSINLIKNSLGNNKRANDISLLGMRQDDDWVLYAAYNDQEKVRNVFSSNLWKYSCATDNQYGIDAGIEYKYLELFINDEYWGLYALGYPVDEKQLGLSTNIEKDMLYKKITWSSDNAIGLDKSVPIAEYEIKVKNSVNNNDWDLLYDYYINLYENRKDSKTLLQAIDLDNSIDLYLFYNMVQGIDNVSNNYSKNMYIAFITKYGYTKSIYVPWDLDITWGNYWLYEDKNYTSEYYLTEDFNRIMESGYINQILINGDTDTWKYLFEKYRTLRSNVWSQEALDTLIDDYEDDIYDSGAYLREMERWPDGSYQSPELKLSKFREYVNNRLSEMDSYMESMEQVYDKGIFIQRSVQYKHFMESDFVIEINDKSCLENENFVDLLEYINVDVSKITDDVRWIIGNGGVYEYINSIGLNGNEFETLIGQLSLYRDNDRSYTDDNTYSIFLNGIYLYDINPNSLVGKHMSFVYDGRAYNFDFTEDFILKSYKE